MKTYKESDPQPILFFLQGLASGWLAIILLLALLILSITGSLVPQKSHFSPEAILVWQKQHPQLSSLLEKIDGFEIYQSFYFNGILLLLLVNILL
ncbi:MAG: hypothetical protein D6785_05560, partial [Planctomycetota bacterium]